jgi:hypothetical protein
MTGFDHFATTQATAAVFGQVTEQFIHFGIVGGVIDETPLLPRGSQLRRHQLFQVKSQATIGLNI